LRVWLLSERAADWVLVTAWLATGSAPHLIRSARRGTATTMRRRTSMYVIGIDPHRGSHAAAVLDGDERVRAVLHLPADRQQRQRLLSWASGFMPREV
jgi:hypothetical protein